jgi:hypothetical protein
MRQHLLPLASLLLVVPAVCNAGAPPAMDSSAAFDRLRSLAGTWETKTDKGLFRVNYEVISGGSAVVERVMVDKVPMETIYHLDGARLLLTHYCMLGNQPRMEAREFDPETGELRFEFLDVTNLSSPAAPHMHNAKFQFVDSDHLNADWELFEGGKYKSTEHFEYTRVQ